MIENSTWGLEIHVTVRLATVTDSAMTQQLRMSVSVISSDIHNEYIGNWPWSASHLHV